MHDNAMDVCCYVVSVNNDGSSNVLWYNLGYTGRPWLINGEVQTIWINGLWRDISAMIHRPRPWENAQ